MTRLVVIDDHAALRSGLAALLERAGHEVVGSVGTMAAAYDLVVIAEPDLALVDVWLPDGSGIDLTRDLLLLHPGLRIVLYTADADARLVGEGRRAGAHGHVLKAGTLDEILTAIAQVQAGGDYLDPRLDPAEPREASAHRLSPRERDVLGLMAAGLTADQVARRLTLSVETVRTHVRNAVRKLRARSRVHAIALALQRGEIALEDLDA